MSSPQCFENPPSRSSGPNGAGTVEELAGLRNYVTGSPDAKRTILLISDVFGFEAPNLRKLADKVAAEGFLVVVPDLLYGDYYDPENPQFDRASWRKAHATDKGCEDTKPLIDALKSKGITAIGAAGFCWGGYEAPNLRKLADKIAAAGYYVLVPDFLYGDPFAYEDACRPLPVWLKDHEPNKAFEDAKPVIEALKRKGVLAIGAASFCWGAKCVVELTKSGMIQAAVLFHPSFITLDDIKGVNIPIAILGAEIDTYCPPDLVKQFEEVLTAKLGIDCYVKVVPKVSHGWTVRYNIEDAAAVMAAEAAHKKLLDWFVMYVK